MEAKNSRAIWSGWGSIKYDNLLLGILSIQWRAKLLITKPLPPVMRTAIGLPRGIATVDEQVGAGHER